MGHEIDRAHLLQAIVERTAELLAAALLNGKSSGTVELPSNGPPVLPARRQTKKLATSPSDVSDETIKQLILEKGPLRVVEIVDATGLSLSAAHKKIAAMKEANILKRVRDVNEGKTVRYAVAARRGRKKAGTQHDGRLLTS